MCSSSCRAPVVLPLAPDTKEECLAQYKGPAVGCFDYDPEGSTWTAFFRLADGSLRVVRKIPSEAECQRYIGAFKSDVPAACRQLAQPNVRSVACRAPEPPPPPPAAKPEPDTAPKPDPASIKSDAAGVYRSGQTCQVGWSQKQCSAYRVADEVQIDGTQYTRVAGLAWTPVTEVPTASREDQPAPPPKQRVARQPQPQQFAPLGEFIAVVTSPIRFATYPARRDW